MKKYWITYNYHINFSSPWNYKTLSESIIIDYDFTDKTKEDFFKFLKTNVNDKIINVSQVSLL